MRNINIRGMITIILIAAILMQSCAFEYESAITPIDWGTGATPQPIETLPPTIGPYGSTCEGDANLFYCRVPCPTGPKTRVCYQLCMSDECGLYAMDNLEVAPRVDAFIFAVHNWQEKAKEYTSKQNTRILSLVGVGAACFAAMGAGLTAAGRMAQQNPPTPEWLAALGIFTFVTSLGGCVVAAGKSIMDRLALPGIAEAEHKWLKDAVDNWSILQSCQGCEE